MNDGLHEYYDYEVDDTKSSSTKKSKLNREQINFILKLIAAGIFILSTVCYVIFEILHISIGKNICLVGMFVPVTGMIINIFKLFGLIIRDVLGKDDDNENTLR